MVRRIVMPPSSGLAFHVVTACTRTWCNMPENESSAILLWELRILQVFLQFIYGVCNLLFVLIRCVEFVRCVLNYRFIGSVWACLHLFSVHIVEAPNSVPQFTRRTCLISSFLSCCFLRWLIVQLLSFMQAFEVLQWCYLQLKSSLKLHCVFGYFPAFQRTLERAVA